MDGWTDRRMFPPAAGWRWRRGLRSTCSHQGSATPRCPLHRARAQNSAPQRTRIVMMKNLNAITGRHKDPFSFRSAHASLCTRQRLPLQQKVPARGKKRAQIKNHVMRVSTLSFIATWMHWASDWRWEGGDDGRALCTWMAEPLQVIPGETQCGCLKEQQKQTNKKKK